jgi:site-specific DNA-cytosine methylase
MVANDVDKRTCVAEPVPFVIGKLADAVNKFGYIPEMWNPYNNAEVTDKSPTLTTCCNSQTSSSSVLIFDKLAVPIEWDENGNPTKAISYADGKPHAVYKVEDGRITIKGEKYPIKLEDGFYIIRKLTITECMRLQTVPEWYDFSVVSDSQAYKCLGNGWTCDVITHLVNACQKAARRKWLDELLR